MEHRPAVLIGQIKQHVEMLPETAGFRSFGREFLVIAGMSQEIVYADCQHFGQLGQDIRLRMAVLAFVIRHGGLLHSESVSEITLAQAPCPAQSGEALAKAGG